jgi:D-tyrosyl-tRNA(Tyr) deacylase
VTIDGKIKASIGAGMLLLLGVEDADTPDDADWLAGKIARMRIFNDADGVMNLSALDTGAEALLVSQFTLHAATRKGNRPSYARAARPEIAVPLYERFWKQLEQELDRPIVTGEFGAHMEIALVNSGPVTILIDTKNRE